MTDNRQVSRSKRFLREALVSLLNEKTYDKITITDITERADLARATFYSHFETKDDLLYSLVDSVLDQFFSSLADWPTLRADPHFEETVGVKFFELWQQHADVLVVLENTNIDRMLIDRFKLFFGEYYVHKVAQYPGNTPDMTHNFANYIVSYNAHAFVGILRQWIADDMRYPPEVMGKLLMHYVGPEATEIAIQRFSQLIT